MKCKSTSYWNYTSRYMQTKLLGYKIKWKAKNAQVTSKQYKQYGCMQPLRKILHRIANWSSSAKTKMKWCKNNQTNSHTSFSLYTWMLQAKQIETHCSIRPSTQLASNLPEQVAMPRQSAAPCTALASRPTQLEGGEASANMIVAIARGTLLVSLNCISFPCMLLGQAVSLY
jgi:hypothetical protein